MWAMGNVLDAGIILHISSTHNVGVYELIERRDLSLFPLSTGDHINERFLFGLEVNNCGFLYYKKTICNLINGSQTNLLYVREERRKQRRKVSQILWDRNYERLKTKDEKERLINSHGTVTMRDYKQKTRRKGFSNLMGS